MKRINLFYLSPNPYGGWVTYTYHLDQALKAAGVEDVRLYKIGKRIENFTRNFGYGLQYRNVSLDYALTLEGPHLIVAAAKKLHEATANLHINGAFLVVHDPTELKNLPTLIEEKVIVIRQTSLEHIPGATFIRHPYKRRGPEEYKIIKYSAISISRIDFDKHTDIILDANRLLEEQIIIRGFENRLYTRFKIVPKYPEWVQSVNQFDREAHMAYDLLLPARYMVDMSIIKGDGGGTQYTFLEAWDAGTIPIIHNDWIIQGHEMVPGVNCLAVGNAEELVEAVGGDGEVGYANHLLLHDPKFIGEQYVKLLEDF